jgi:site-specific DNA-methyltransferase (adenine-specific)
MSFTIHTGDVLDVLRTLESNSFDGCLSDPPYGLSFMGAQWDKGVPSSAVWNEVLRVLKPGASLLAFGGTRTQHRLTCAIEDGGFEIRDCLMWLYGSGFPKSLDISKALDKARGYWRVRASNRKSQNAAMSGPNYGRTPKGEPITSTAQLWSGYGTALKPAYEPCIMALKPMPGSFALNATTYGVAGIDIDGSRIGTDVVGWGGNASGGYSGGLDKEQEARPVEGRWPANVILDETFSGNTWSRYFYCSKASTSERNAGLEKDSENAHPCVKPLELNMYLANLILPPPRTDAPRRLLVPFSGSGSEMIGAMQAGWEDVTGIEKEAEYVKLAEARIQHWIKMRE